MCPPLCVDVLKYMGEEWVKSCCELFTPAIALFIGIPEGLVKSEEYFRVCFHIIFIGQDYDISGLYWCSIFGAFNKECIYAEIDNSQNI